MYAQFRMILTPPLPPLPDDNYDNVGDVGGDDDLIWKANIIEI